MAMYDEFRSAAIKSGIIATSEESEADDRRRGEDLHNEFMEDHPEAKIFLDKIYIPCGINLIRRTYRYLSGIVFKSPYDLFEKSKDRMIEGFMPTLFEALATGVMLGRANNDLVTGINSESGWYELAENEDFRAQALLLGQEFTADEEMLAEARRYIEWSVLEFGERTGVSIMPAEWSFKVWDVWFFAFQICTLSFLFTGYTMGQDKRIQDTLNGILEASGETDG